MSAATKPPLITVLLPVRNGAAHVGAAIESILGQSLTDFELLVIDDGSTDGTPTILDAIQDPRLRIVTHPKNIGLVPTLNEGLELARGEWIARQDHDDISHPQRLQRQMEYLRAHPECALVGTEAWQTDVHGRTSFQLLRPLRPTAIRWYLCFDNAFIHSTVMFRCATIRGELRGYAPSFHSEDYALWSRIARAFPTANLPEPLLRFREHGSSVTGSMSAPDQGAFDAATGAIREENLRMLFGSGDFTTEVRVLSTYRRDFSKATAQAFLEVFDRLAGRLTPPPEDAADVRRTQAIQLAELGYRLLPVSRGMAWQLHRRALALHPPLSRLLPWRRIAALWLLGGFARTLYTWIFGK